MAPVLSPISPGASEPNSFQYSLWLLYILPIYNTYLTRTGQRPRPTPQSAGKHFNFSTHLIGRRLSVSSKNLAFAETTMSDLPCELLDHIVDFLHNDQTSLKKCCLVSKSWIPRSRKCLFAVIRFHCLGNLQSWKKAYPDPSTSLLHVTPKLYSLVAPESFLMRMRVVG